MNRSVIASLCLLVGLNVCNRIAYSADIQWQPDAFDIETDADIDLSGTIVRAVNVSTLDPEFDIIDVELGGQFIEFIPEHTFEPVGGDATANGNYYTGGDLGQMLTTGNDDLDQVLNDHGWVSGGEGTLAEFTLEDLTVGTSYQIQLIGAADDRNCCWERRQVVVDDNLDFVSPFFGRQTDWDDDGEPGPGSVIGTFTADDTMQTIIIMGSSEGEGPGAGPPNDPGISAYILSEVTAGGPQLQPGDADMDLDFDQLDLVQVQIAAKYLTGQPATWGEGDWDGAPGGTPGDPPPGNGFFDQLDIISALTADVYLKGPYAAIATGGRAGDGQTSITYNPTTGELGVDAPDGVELTSINIDSAAGIFTGDPAQNLGGSFDNDADSNIFKATFGSSFGSLSFGNVAPQGLLEATVAADLTVVGSLAGGGGLGDVDLIYVPEPSSAMLVVGGLIGMLLIRRRQR